jgi:hypothetical protein
MLTKIIDDLGWHYVTGPRLNVAISHAAWQENGYEGMSDDQLVAALRSLCG